MEWQGGGVLFLAREMRVSQVNIKGSHSLPYVCTYHITILYICMHNIIILYVCTVRTYSMYVCIHYNTISIYV